MDGDGIIVGKNDESGPPAFKAKEGLFVCFSGFHEINDGFGCGVKDGRGGASDVHSHTVAGITGGDNQSARKAGRIVWRAYAGRRSVDVVGFKEEGLGCTEGSDEEAELAAIAELLDAYQTARQAGVPGP